VHGPGPALYDFISGVERFPDRPDTPAPYDLLVISDCGSLERIGEVGVRHADLFARLPRVIIDHHARTTPPRPADWIDPDFRATWRDGDAPGAPDGIPLDRR
jgi:nanoRNase/pAp phosphatase (c-di-AMP/oligoRNAs hydrolase)